jgi:penicillin-binding protein 1A
MSFDGRNDGGPPYEGQPIYVHTPAPMPEGAPARSGSFSELPLRFRVVLLAPIVLLLCSAAAVGALFIYYTFVFPDPLSMRQKATGPVVRILGRDGSLVAERGVSRAYIPLDMLPPHVANAVVATEDRRFFEHAGLDPWGLMRAALVNLRAGRFTQGGSTLTQQLAKNLFLSSERTVTRKAEEMVLALWLELRLSKHDILELYLNRVYFGGGAHGIEAASQRYFAKSARDLSVAEAAVIAGLLKAPSKYAPSASPIQALARGRVVIGKMVEAGVITEADAEAARASEVRFSSLMRVPDQADMAYAVDYVLEGAAKFESADPDEIVIETTLDPILQRRAGEIVEAALGQSGASLDASQAAVVVLAQDGGVRALVGGRSYADSQFNRAVKALRQPGSSFKPVVYLTAVERGLTPDSIVQDAPVSIRGWSPKNENGRYLGPTTLRNALAHSINSVAVRLTLDVGADKVAATARRLGMKSVLRNDASLALGTSEVSLLDLTGAYAAFANGGYVNEPYVIRKVRTGAGRVLFRRITARSDPAIPARSVAAMNDMLQETLASGTGRRAVVAGQIAAGKTGTSQDFRDAWFVGYTAYLTAGVWVGNDDGRTMNNVRGGTLPADIWREVMTVAHQGKTPMALPDGLERVRPPVDAPSHPAGSIADDFIAKALGNDTLESRDLADAQGGAKGSTHVTTTGRIIVRPPALR